jgi:tetratricopeptide (TPR) repeat protein
MKLLKLIFLFILIFSNLNASSNYFNEGVSFFNEKKLEKAKFSFEKAIVFNPKNIKAYLYLSKIFNAQNNIKLEKQNLNTVILLNPSNEEATYNLAKLKLSESDFLGSKMLNEKLIVFCKEYCNKSEKLKLEIKNSQKR